MNLAPIALFVYNRPDHTRKTIAALKKNELASQSQLFIFSDGPKNEAVKSAIEEVRKYLKTIDGFKRVEIIERPENQGLAESIISGVTQIVNQYGRVIVLEDDLVTSPHFLTYMNEALQLYENDDRVASIHGYVYPVNKPLPETFFLRGADCWGWATWKRAWADFEQDGKKLLEELEKRHLLDKFDLDGAYSYSGMLRRQVAGETNSWAIRWHADNFLKNKLTLYPGRSLVNNIGADDSGTHSGNNHFEHRTLESRRVQVLPIPVEENEAARQTIANFLRKVRHPGIVSRLLRRIFS